MTEIQTFDINQVKFKMIGLLDINEFKEAAKESIESNYEFLGYGRLFQHIRPAEYLAFFLDMLKDPTMDHYGLFDKGKLLGHVTHSIGFGPYGIEIIGWVRSSYHNLGIGELGLEVASRRAFEHKEFNYAELHINENNKASRAVAEKVGFFPVAKLAGSRDPYATVIYLKLNPRIYKLARQYNRNPLDLINCPATSPGLQSYIASDRVVQFYEWPFPKFQESAEPFRYTVLDDYAARVHFSPAGMQAN